MTCVNLHIMLIHFVMLGSVSSADHDLNFFCAIEIHLLIYLIDKRLAWNNISKMTLSVLSGT